MNETEQTVFIVDDDPSFLKAASRLLTARGFNVRAFPSAGDFLAQVGADAQGCVVADLKMPGVTGLELQATLASSGSPMPLLFLTGHGDITSSVQAMRGGAEDFLEKTASQEVLIDAVSRALVRDARGREARSRRSSVAALFASLSPREHEVLAHVLQGQLNKQIAYKLNINERTVKLHRTSMTRKLGVRSVAEIMTLAQQAGLTGAAPTFPKGK